MTEDKSMFTSLSSKDDGYVTFGDNSKGKIIGIGNVGKEPSPIIENVLLVDGLKHNLFSISQLCDRENRVIFDNATRTIENIKDNKTLFIGQIGKNVYVFTTNDVAPTNETCLTAMNDDGWLWHRKHAHINLIPKLFKKDLVIGLPKHLLKNIDYVEHVNKGNKLKYILNQKILFSPLGHYNFYTWI